MFLLNYRKQPALSLCGWVGIWRASVCSQTQMWADSGCGWRLRPHCKPRAQGWRGAAGRQRSPGAPQKRWPGKEKKPQTIQKPFRCKQNILILKESLFRLKTKPLSSDLSVPLQNHYPHPPHHFSRKVVQETFLAMVLLCGWGSVLPGLPDIQKYINQFTDCILHTT